MSVERRVDRGVKSRYMMVVTDDKVIIAVSETRLEFSFCVLAAALSSPHEPGNIIMSHSVGNIKQQAQYIERSQVQIPRESINTQYIYRGFKSSITYYRLTITHD
jgi:uncharacterized membrane protein YczE